MCFKLLRIIVVKLFDLLIINKSFQIWRLIIELNIIIIVQIYHGKPFLTSNIHLCHFLF